MIAERATISRAAERRWRRIVRDPRLLSPLVLLVALFAWDRIVIWMQVPTYVLPAPASVGRALVNGFSSGLYVEHLLWTIRETVLGFLVASVVATAVGAILVQSRTLEAVVQPYLVAFQSFPKIALAPMIVLWLGYDVQSKVAVAAVTAFFPVVINVMTGLRTVDRDRLDLMTALRADRWQTFRELRFPNALPFLFAGLQLALVFAMLGAIVGEFVGSRKGLGVLLLTYDADLDIAGVFSIFVILALLGVVLFTAMQWISRRIVFWTDTETIVA